MTPAQLLALYYRTTDASPSQHPQAAVEGMAAVRDAVLEDAAQRIEIMAASPLGNGEAERWLRQAAERVRKLKGGEGGGRG